MPNNTVGNITSTYTCLNSSSGTVPTTCSSKSDCQSSQCCTGRGVTQSGSSRTLTNACVDESKGSTLLDIDVKFSGTVAAATLNSKSQCTSDLNPSSGGGSGSFGNYLSAQIASLMALFLFSIQFAFWVENLVLYSRQTINIFPKWLIYSFPIPIPFPSLSLLLFFSCFLCLRNFQISNLMLVHKCVSVCEELFLYLIHSFTILLFMSDSLAIQHNSSLLINLKRTSCVLIIFFG